MYSSVPRVVIGAVSSGCGKTTVVTGLLAALRQMKIKVQSYKIGPDYIDPGYHKLASGCSAHNIDTWLMSQTTMQNLFIDTAQDSELVVIEGVMGLYDGGNKGISSTAQIAKILKAPVILVIDCKAMGASAAAIAKGFQSYDPEVNFAGVILNRLGSDNHQRMIEEALGQINIPVLGAIRRNNDLVMPERHLGLLPVEENKEQGIIEQLGETMKHQLKTAEIMQIATAAEPLLTLADESDEYLQQVISGRKRSFPDDFGKIRIGVARDEAFSFYYPESLAILTKMGAQLVEFSPLSDLTLPDVDGIILGGGFPEMFIDRLSANETMLDSIRQAAKAGMPIYAECGGYMYLTQALRDFTGFEYKMAGILPTKVEMKKKLQMVGYVEATLLQDSIIGKQGMKFRGHEFHFSTEVALKDETPIDETLRAFEFKKVRNETAYLGGLQNSLGNVLGSYLHIHFAGCPEAAAALVRSCWNYNLKKTGA